VKFFRTVCEYIAKVETMEEEAVGLHHVAMIPELKTIANLQWLIPLALDYTTGYVNIKS
jgi:hypothetical protein